MLSFKEFLLLEGTAYDTKLASMKKTNGEIIQTYFDKISKVVKSQNDVLWCLQYLEQNLNSLEIFDDFLEELNHYQLYIPKVEFKGKKAEDIVKKLKDFYDAELAKQDKNKGITPQENDQILIDCKSGNTWWFVDRAYCPEEGRSGNHCGNVVGQHTPDQRILSLRNPQNQVIMTFILEPDNTLGEMKAKGNLKPSKDYHNDIMELLTHSEFTVKKSKKKNFQITGISGKGYLPHMNFSIFDLSEEDLAIIHKHNKKFITDQISINPTEILGTSETIKNLYKGSVKPQIRSLINDPSSENWKKAIVKYPKLIIFVPKEYWDGITNYKDILIKQLVKSDDLLLKAPPSISKDFEILKGVITLEPKRIRLIQNTYKNYDDLLLMSMDKDSNILYDTPKEYISKKVAKVILDNHPKYFGYVKKEFIPEGYKIDLKGKKDLIFKANSISSLKGICPKIIPGSFNCSSNSGEENGENLTSLEGAPEIVKKDFSVNMNSLTSLKGGPKQVGGNYDCSGNKLTSLEGAPEIISGHFDCNENKLTSLKGSPKIVKKHYNCSYNKLTSLEGGPESVRTFSCINNKLTSLKGGPKNVTDYYYCSENNLTSLEGSPEIIEREFNCAMNKLESLEGCPKEVKGNFNCEFNKKRFTEADVRKLCKVGGVISV